MRLCTLAAFVSGASALHLSGPMDDRLNACSALHCPDSWGPDPDDFDGMGISFPTFVNPATGNSGRFLYELEYVLNVLGHDDGRTLGEYTYYDGEMTDATCASTDANDAAGAADFDACAAVTDLDDDTACLAVMKDAITATAGSAATCVVKAGGTTADTEACACVTDLDDTTACSAVVAEGGGEACDYTQAEPEVEDEAACTYTAAERVPKTRTAVGKTGLTHLQCMCTNCASTVEAIFQPVSRDLCKVISDVDQPCATELATCETAEGNLRTSGTAATFDSVYAVIGGPVDANGAATPNPNQCSPAASFFAYKNDWKLNEFAAEAEDGTCTKAGSCTAVAEADATECEAAADQTACEAIESSEAAATCESTDATDATGDADFDECAAVTALDTSTACEAVKTAAIETCAADGAANGAAIDPGACTYTPAVPAADKCAWGGATVLGAEVVAYQKCIANSRATAFDADHNCLTSVGASTCGGEYQCTYVVEDVKTSGAAATAAAVSIVALAIANL